MRITVSEGQAAVTWNDRGDPHDPPFYTAEGLQYTLNDEQTLRDLYSCLDFLFGRPK